MTIVSTFLQRVAQPWFVFLAEDPALRLLQLGMLFVGVVVIFLVFYTTRDILLRTHSFWYMFFSIVFVAALPIVGFSLYLLFRPSRTNKEREMEKLLTEILVEVRKSKRRLPGDTKGGIMKKLRKKQLSEEDLAL